MTRAKDISKIVTDADLSGTLDVTGDLTVDTNTLHVDSTNNRVGIGTSSPTERLTIAGNMEFSNQGSKIVFAAGNASSNTIRAEDNDGYASAQIAFLGTGSSQSHAITLSTGSSPGSEVMPEHMRITSGGYVGIGTSSPSELLEVNSTGSSAAIEVSAGQASTTTGEAKIVLRSLHSSSGTTYSRSEIASLGVAGGDSDLIFRTTTTSSGPVERMRIDSSGNVGIGTSSPNAPLNVNGTVELAGVLYRGIFGGTYQDSDIGALTGGNPAAVQIQSASSNRPATLLLGGAQGTNEILGTIGFYNSGNTDTKRLRSYIYGGQSGGTTNEQGGVLVFGTASDAGTTPTEAMRIDTSGNLLVGSTTSPSTARLQVREDTNASDTLQVSSQLQFAGQYHDLAIGIDDFYAVGMRRHLTSSTPAYLNPRLDFFVQNHNTYLKGNRGVKMTILNNGNVGIGTSSPDRELDLVKSSDSCVMSITSGTSNVSGVVLGDTADDDRGGILYSNSGDYLYFLSNASERMRILSNGDVLIGSTTGSYSSSSNNKLIEGNGQAFFARAVTGEAGQLTFANPNGNVGQIRTSGSTTIYATTSDHRLKENVTADWDATTRLKQLNPVRFNFIADADTTVDGFLAHEVQSVVPEAITGTHNEVEVWEDGEELPDGVSVGDNKLDEDGNTIPAYQGIDQAKLVPLLVKTIQELEARITALENGE